MKPIILALLVLTGAVRGLGDVLKVPPASPDLSRRYVFYLHGGVVTGSDGRPFTKEFGPYEYRAILKRFSDDGFVVISEIRPDDDDPGRYAGKVAGWISQLKKSGVSSSRISVVGASMGGVIAAHVSALLGDPGISYVILAGLYDDGRNAASFLESAISFPFSAVSREQGRGFSCGAGTVGGGRLSAME